MFVHFNPNPHYTLKSSSWNRGDCVIRSICCAMTWDWPSAYLYAFLHSMEVGDIPNSSSGFQKIMYDLGFERIICDDKKQTVKDFAQEHKNEICICSVQGLTGHVVCCRDGNYYDTFDSGKYCVYGYHIRRFHEQPECNECWFDRQLNKLKEYVYKLALDIVLKRQS